MKRYIALIAFSFFIMVGAFATVSDAYTSPLALTHTLTLKSTGSDVSSLQEFLKEKGFFTYSSITGYFGQFTKDAVIAFQKTYSIDPVGIAGPLTRAKILELTQSVAQSSTISTPITPLVMLRGGGRSGSSGQHITDTDGDGIRDTSDNCPLVANANQVDSDADGVGDACDNCPDVSNVDQTDTNDNGIGNACEVVNYTLSASNAGTGSGTVTSSPAGINCGMDCSEDYASGTVVDLTASTAVGSTFAGWSGACTGTGACVVTMSDIVSVTATFNLSSYALTVAKAGTGVGTVTSSPAGVNCGSTCSASFSHGTVVTLVATPAMGSAFTGWSGGGCSGTGSCVVTMTSPTTVTAVFDTP